MHNLIKTIKKERGLQFILFAGLIIQLLTASTAHGFFYPDQHFQIIEFSSLQLHKPSFAPYIWEYTDKIRSTLQVYMFSGYTLLCNFTGFADPFDQLTLLRVLQSLIYWFMLNAAAIWYFSKADIKVLYIVLALLNFSWFLPYSRTLFSSEITSSLLFFAAFFYFHRKAINDTVNIRCLLLTGFLFALSFFLRFQFGFALIGFGCWLLIEKKFQWILSLAIGFAIGMALNVALDSSFYHQFVFTPFRYFKENILDGKAALFGSEGVLYYPLVMFVFLTVPPLSAVLFFYYGKISLRQFRNPLVLIVLFFIAGHFLVGHKEERFMFPVINILPIILGFGLTSMIAFYNSNKTWRRFLRTVLIFSVLLNSFLLIGMIFTPYSQTVSFAYILSRQFKNGNTDIYCLSRTPLETESHLSMVFYSSDTNIHYISINNNDSLRNYIPQPEWLVTTYNQMKSNKKMIANLGYHPVAYSSYLLWKINTFLDEKNFNTINDIWVLYKK